jgi:molecular chaperone GrpE
MTSNDHTQPSEPATNAGEQDTTPAEKARPIGEIEAPSDPVARLQDELAAAKSDAEQWRDRFLRKAAELENFRKRTEKEKGETAVLAKSLVLAEILPVVDGIERALAGLAEARESNESLARYGEGIQLLHKQLLDTLRRLGVVPMDAVGQRFDPHFHEALVRLETADQEENLVVQELRRGYLFNDRLLRPAQVAVSTRPTARDTSES